MAEPRDGNGEPSRGLFWIFFFLIAGIGGGASFLYKDAEKARTALEDAKRDYLEMQQLKRIVAEGKAQRRKLPNPKESGEDTLTFLDRKRAQAGIPPSKFAPSPDRKLSSGWIEKSYTVQIQGTKDQPVSRDAVADFLVGVETERPSVKSKNLMLSFAPSSPNFSSVSVTLSQFHQGQRD